MTCTNWNHLGIKRSRDKEWNPIDGLHRNNCCEMSFYFNSFGLKENIDIHWTLIKIWIYESLMTCSDWNHLGIIRCSDEECFSIDALQSDNWCGMTSCFNSIWLKENIDVHCVQMEVTWESKDTLIRNWIQLMDFKNNSCGMTFYFNKKTLIHNEF